MPINVEILETPDPACDAFIKENPQGRLTYLSAWAEMIASTFGYKSFYLIAREKGVEGVLPMMQAKSLLFGNRMVSQAFSSYGGIIANSDAARDALFNKAVELAHIQRCETIEFRNIKPLPYDLYLREDKLTMFIPLEAGAEHVWNKARPEVRKQTRKAIKNGLVAVDGGAELMDVFYDIYSSRMHELGTPAFPRKLMAMMIKRFPDNVRLFVVRLGDVTVSAGLVTCFNGIAEIPWSATISKYNRLYPNRLLYWTMIKYYGDRGARLFDFGRSSVGSGNYEFKRRWRAEPVKLHYQYWVRPGHKLSIASPDNPKYQKKVRMWKKLPLWMARLVGPIISRRLV